MGLYSDSDIITGADLAAIDSEVTAVAASSKPGIALDGPGSICEQAWQECGRRILQAMQMYTSYLTQPGMTGGHIAAVLNTGVPARTQPRARLNQIVAHDPNYSACDSQVERWMKYHALAIFYRDVSARLGKDRYEEKMTRYASDAERWWRGLRNEGLPFVWQPLEAPGAKHGFNAGTWTAANLSSTANAGAVGGVTVQVAVTYYDSSRYQSQAANGNAQSGPSQILPFIIPAASVLHIDITSLNPPTGQQDPVGLSAGAWTPLTATHWSVWVGQQDGPLYLQQDGIPIATKTYTAAGDPVFSGTTLGQGQWPDLNMVFQNLVMRA